MYPGKLTRENVPQDLDYHTQNYYGFTAKLQVRGECLIVPILQDLTMTL